MKKYKVVNKFRFSIFILFLFLVLLISVLSIKPKLSYGNGLNTEYETYNYEIKENDSLWNIASNFKPDSMSNREYISKIKEYNSFTKNNKINVGERLNLPIIK